VSSLVDVDRVATDALVVARVLDAASGLPRSVRSASTAVPHAFAHVATGGRLVLSGRVDLVLPDLAVSSTQLESHLEFDDRSPLDLQFTVPAGSALPYRPPDVEVELPPVSLSGTIQTAAFPITPIGGAAIGISGPPGLVGLRTPLAAAHPAGTAVQARTLAAAAPATSLAEPADQNADAVVLASVAGCVAGAVLVLGDEPTLEHSTIAAVDAGLKRVSLVVPLRRSRPAGAPARAYALTGAGASSTLSRTAEAGDGVVELAAAVANAVVEIDGAAPELRAVGAITDTGGRWRLDGVRAVGRLDITVTAAGFQTAGPLAYDVDYRRPNVIDLSLTV
jgi:hypothetical protein